jgi:hypothetical protein
MFVASKFLLLKSQIGENRALFNEKTAARQLPWVMALKARFLIGSDSAQNNLFEKQ